MSLKARNVFNIAEIEDLLEKQAKGKQKNFQLWLKSNLRNAIIRDWPARPVLPASTRYIATILSGTSHKRYDQFMSKFFFVKDKDAPDWLKAAFENGDDIWYVPLEQARIQSIIDHWYDYVKAEISPDKAITAITVSSMSTLTLTWVERINKEKVLSDDLKQITKLWSNETHLLVRLDTKDAYALEGQRMNNCVKSYWSAQEYSPKIKEMRDMLSLRTLDNSPLVTLEAYKFDYVKEDQTVVKYLVIQQVKANANTKPSVELIAIIRVALDTIYTDRKVVPEKNLPRNVARAFDQAIGEGENEDEDEDEDEDDEEPARGRDARVDDDNEDDDEVEPYDNDENEDEERPRIKPPKVEDESINFDAFERQLRRAVGAPRILRRR